MKIKEKRFSKVEWSWIFYDWANSIWSTNIDAAIWPIYFAVVVDRLANAGQINNIYGYAVSAANFIVAIMAPFLGGIGDFKGMKKKLWKIFMLIGVAFTLVMAVFNQWQLMLIGFVVSRIGFSGSILFYDSFLTDITTPERMEKVSSWGYAMGYIGGSTIPFIISIVIMFLMDMSDLSYKIAIGIVPVWWLLFSIPFWKNVEQVHYVETPPTELLKAAVGNTVRTFKEILSNKVVLFFILAYFFYIDGVGTIISMATNYGSTLGLGTIGMILALLVTQIVAMPFSIFFGNWGKKYGALKMITIAVVVYTVITIIGFGMGFIVDFHEMLGMSYDEAIGISSVLFWVLATLVGTVQGGIQALSRSYFGQIIPPERSNEYYGFLDIFGKFAAVIGPALYALVFGLSGKASYGILSVIILFILGLVFLKIGKPYFTEHEMKKAES
ncbi:MAG: MFS transporter [Oscillospiraceae bacterium]|nr:MFS transporter [Oscillospiraceae bacterium]